MSSYVDWFCGFWIYLASFYTGWTWILFFLYAGGLLPHQYARSLLMMQTTSSVGGAYITYVRPRVIKVLDLFPVDFVIQGAPLVLADMATHHLPLLYTWHTIPKDAASQDAISLYVALSALFLLVNNNLYELYGIEGKDLAIIVFATSTIFLSIYIAK